MTVLENHLIVDSSLVIPILTQPALRGNSAMPKNLPNTCIYIMPKGSTLLKRTITL